MTGPTFPTGDIVIRIPDGNPPQGGWPVLVFLHGCGERASTYSALATAAAAAAFVSIAPSGPMILPGGGRSWMTDLAATDACIQSAFAGPLSGLAGVLGGLYLCGFSQGATHAYGLLAGRPDRYSGAIILSPGEGPDPPGPPPAEAARPMYLSYGKGEYRVFRQRAQKWGTRWQRSGHPCRIEPHPGGHHYPIDWFTRFPLVAAWLLSFRANSETSKILQQQAVRPNPPPGGTSATSS
ncbi:MAG: hypothetical protein JSS02_00795 [Planctomycetes bacterium]|nr:hypothetical protein [Planctomycetota bacterium]